MGETLSAQVISMGARLVADRSGAVKAESSGHIAEIDLLQPPFESELTAGPRLWLRRWLWRRQLRAAFRHEPDAVLKDFGLSRDRLEGCLARPFWRA